MVWEAYSLGMVSLSAPQAHVGNNVCTRDYTTSPPGMTNSLAHFLRLSAP
jgi:hypothetical protein